VTPNDLDGAGDPVLGFDLAAEAAARARMAGSLTAEWMVSTAGVFLRRPSGASGMRLGGGGLAGPDGVALGAVLAGAGLAAGAGEGVDRWAVLHLDQAKAFDDRLPSCARQGTGNSPGPQVDVA
jgi:hypothetical protein